MNFELQASWEMTGIKSGRGTRRSILVEIHLEYKKETVTTQKVSVQSLISLWLAAYINIPNSHSNMLALCPSAAIDPETNIFNINILIYYLFNVHTSYKPITYIILGPSGRPTYQTYY